MALIYNNVTPLAILYGGTYLTAVKYGDVGVWGKPYSLYTETTNGVNLTITRTESPNQNAELGTLTDGSVIYHGDTLVISYTMESGYKFLRGSINGVAINSTTTTITVESSVTVSISTESAYTWHTLTTGNTPITTNTAIVRNTQFALKYRVYLTSTNEEWSTDYSQTIEMSLTETKEVYGQFEDIVDVHVERCGTFTLTGVQNGPKLEIYGTFDDRTGEISNSPYSLVLTKLEAYY